jgi:hypothetical protein
LWTTADNRTQGGGYLWFPGNGSGKSVETADLLAKGRALEAMKEECEGFFSGTIFVDRHVEYGNREVIVWVRALVKQEDCIMVKRGEAKQGKTLKTLYVDYRVLIARADTSICNNSYKFTSIVLREPVMSLIVITTMLR